MTRAANGRARALVVAIGVAFAIVVTDALADETVAIYGRIVASATSRHPLGRTSVVVRDTAGRELHLRVDRDGRYAAIGLTAGSIDVSVTSEGFAPERQSCDVSDGDTLRLDFDLVDHYTFIGKRSFACRIEPQTADRYVVR